MESLNPSTINEYIYIYINICIALIHMTQMFLFLNKLNMESNSCKGFHTLAI